MDGESASSPRPEDEAAVPAPDRRARMFELARAGDRRLLDHLESGVPVDLVDGDGNTLLMLAAYHGHTGLVRVLAERGADPNRTNDRSQTALSGAVFQGDVETVRALVELGADPAAGEPSAIANAHAFGRMDLLEDLEAGFPEPDAT